MKMLSFGFLFLQLLILNQVSSQTISDNNATKETIDLYNKLTFTTTKGILFGHHDATLYGVGWKSELVPNWFSRFIMQLKYGRHWDLTHYQSDVNSVCGDFPAIYEWDFGGLEKRKDDNKNYIRFNRLRRHIIAADARGGINAFCWHINNPVTGKYAGDADFHHALQSILKDSSNHQKYVASLNAVAKFILSLKDKNGKLIPILFRPFHEHTGSWFWWGKDNCTHDEFVSLYRFTIDYLRDSMQVHNMIITYSPDKIKNQAEYLDRYPGDDIVDIMGLDYYYGEKQNFKEKLRSTIDTVALIAKSHHKIMALSETGDVCLKDSLWWTQQLLPAIANEPLCYVLVWRNAHNKHFFAPYPGSSSVSDFLLFKNSGQILFQKDLNKISYCSGGFTTRESKKKQGTQGLLLK